MCMYSEDRRMNYFYILRFINTRYDEFACIYRTLDKKRFFVSIINKLQLSVHRKNRSEIIAVRACLPNRKELNVS